MMNPSTLSQTILHSASIWRIYIAKELEYYGSVLLVLDEEGHLHSGLICH